jgi:CDP-diacylglycerol pyrophosphatase
VRDLRHKRRYLLIAGGLVVLGAAALFMAERRVNHSSRLWQIVHERCVPGQEQQGNPAPCALVHLQDGVQRGYVVLKDLVGVAQYLLLPTVRITGIESPGLLLPDTPNYFADAWRERGFVERAARHSLPRTAISLAVNAVQNRSQNQLHIHMDCVRLNVQATLQRLLGAIGDNWAMLPEPLVGHSYRARRLLAEDLAPANPFLLLADGVPDVRNAMGAQTLTVVGAQFADGKPGFVILNAQVDLGAGVIIKGEELQDHSCAIARE